MLEIQPRISWLTDRRQSVQRSSGFALLIVLWSLVLIGLLTTRIIASGRTATFLAKNVLQSAEARVAADGAINQAIFHLLAADADHWGADGRIHVVVEGSIRVTLVINSLAGTINPNLASTNLLDCLFRAVGVDLTRAHNLANALGEWRSPAQSKRMFEARLANYRNLGLPYAPPGRPFFDLSELGYVAGMSPDLLARVMPYLSLDQIGDPNLTVAAPAVRKAVALLGESRDGLYASGSNIFLVEISAVAKTKSDLEVHRFALAKIFSQNGDASYQLVSLTGGY